MTVADADEAAEYRGLFVAVARALAFDALRMKPREKQLALLLASESFGEGSAFGAVDMEAWRLRLATWRSNELKDMLRDWRRAGWISVDVTEQTFRLAPDQFPGWASVQAIQRSEERVVPLRLHTEDDLHKTFAKISQVSAVRDAKISQNVTKFSHGGEPMEGNVQTFNRLTSERLNVERSRAREAVTAEQIEHLRAGVRQFVGQSDWANGSYWNHGMGWRARLFIEEYTALSGALNSCRAALADRDSSVTVRKTRGAMLWDEFQRLRRRGNF